MCYELTYELFHDYYYIIINIIFHALVITYQETARFAQPRGLRQCDLLSLYLLLLVDEGQVGMTLPVYLGS